MTRAGDNALLAARRPPSASPAHGGASPAQPPLIAPGAATGYHKHEYDYVIVPGTTGKLKLIGPDGEESIAELTAGQCYFRQAGVEHDVINANDFPFSFVEVELK